MSIISDAVNYSRLALDLRTFLRDRISLEQSKQVIIERLRNRERNFLSLVQRGIYENPRSPYLRLLRIAGCEFGDIECQVNRDGIEPTLQSLLADGVYLSWEEFKGKKDVQRGGTRFRFREGDLDNPYIPGWYRGQSSGSRSAGTRTKFDLKNQLQASYYRLPMLAACDALDVPLAAWKPIPPSMSGISHVLSFWIAEKPVARWFSPVDERQAGTPLQHRLALRYIIYGSRLWGARLAKPEPVSLNRAQIVAQWMADTKRAFGGCSLSCSVSSGVKVCQAAADDGLDIRGTGFLVSGEPLTEAKRRQIEAVGASVFPRYTISEIGRVGLGCAKATGDDLHLLSDAVAMIQRRRQVEHTDITVNSFLYTPLLLSAPKILLNVESDDCGIAETRGCDCVLGQLGLNRHLHDIRSFTKLTGHGMTIIGSDFVRILEEVLPRTYGGSAADYQLLEEEDARGRTRLSLIVSPGVGTVDDDAIIGTVLRELRRSVHAGGLTASLWSQAEALRVKRMDPLTRCGKVATLHLTKLEPPAPD